MQGPYSLATDVEGRLAQATYVSLTGFSQPISLGPILRATLAGNVIPPQIAGKKTEGETNQNRDRQIKHFGRLLGNASAVRKAAGAGLAVAPINPDR